MKNLNLDFLQSLQNRLKPSDYKSASAAMQDFHGILKKIDLRFEYTGIFLPESFLLWDLRPDTFTE